MGVEDVERPSEEERDSHYKPGSIKRVKLRNFLTYDDVEFWPGPRLNVVVGPNGTGKSTILCAICLGLGGQPPLLGRADDARLFIKHEKDQATIEIEMAPHVNSDSGRVEAVHVIRRVIDRDRGSEGGRGAGASTYFINGHKSTLKNVKELVSERYHIHIDNLCTFLPQDKVGNFSGFNKQSLLAETEKSLSGHLYTTHQDLIDLERALQTSGTDLAGIEGELDNLKKENERLEREKELMEEREACLERIDLLKRKRAWLVFDKYREEAKVSKERREELKRQKKEAERGLRPLTEKHADAEKNVSHIQTRYKALETKVKKDRKAWEDSLVKSDKYYDDIDREVADYQTIEAEMRRAERDLEKERRRLQEIEAEGDDFPPIEEIDRAIKKKQTEMRQLKSRISTEKGAQGATMERIDRANQDREEASNRLNKLKDDKKLRLQRLFAMAKKVGAAYQFIDQNKKMFRKPVWGPIAAEVEPKDQLTAAYLEQHVAQNTWKAFVVECKEDYDLLYREIREKRKIPINIITVEKTKTPIRIYSEERMDVLRREHGFTEYLDETFVAPDRIMQALIDRHNIDKVLVGGEAVHTSLERKDLVEFLSTREKHDRRPGKLASCFFYTSRGSSYKYTTQVSRYSGKTGTDQADVGKAKLLRPGSDPAEKDALAERVREAEELIERLRPEYDEAKGRIDEMNTQGQTLALQFKEAKRTGNDYKHYKIKLANQKDKLAEAEENANKDNEREKAKKIAKIKKLVENSITMNESAATIHNDVMKNTLILTGVKVTEDGLSDNLRKLADLLNDKKAESADLNNQFNAADADYNQKKSELRKLLKDAEKLAPREEWQERLEQDDMPTELEEVEEALDEAETKVDSIAANPHVMRQYEERKREIAKLQKQLEEAGGEKDMKRRQLEVKLNRWEAALANIVKSVSTKFSDYMKEVGCAGEVRLYNAGEGEGENLRYNFKDWGVEILVKFREASKLQVLSAQTHSGGERSVSTIMYLMGLQNLMSSPFRCVDEINQGLDERNERLVFKRIVENSTIPAESSNSDHCGQYFLITPKLLPNLEGMENENITVLFVFSGAHNFKNCLDWNVDKFIREKRRFFSQESQEVEPVRRGSGRNKRRKSR